MKHGNILYACIIAYVKYSIECMSSRPKVSFTDHSYSGLPPGSRSRSPPSPHGSAALEMYNA